MKRGVTKVRIVKAGGSVLGSASNRKRLIEFLQSTSKPQILVVSAFGQTTKLLKAICQHKSAKPFPTKDLTGLYGKDAENLKLSDIRDISLLEKLEWALALTFIARYHHNAMAQEGLASSKAGLAEGNITDLELRIQEIFDEIQGLVRERPTRSNRARILTRGEYVAALIMEAILRKQGIECEIISPENIIKTEESNPLCAEIYETQTLVAIRQAMIPKLRRKKIIIVPGYTGSGINTGQTTCLGDNTSDLTAAVIARMVRLSMSHPANNRKTMIEFYLTKDTVGWQSIVDKRTKPIHIPNITIEEAIKAVEGWRQAIVHPEAIKGLLELGIKIFIRGIQSGKVSRIVLKRNDTKGFPLVAVIPLKTHCLIINGNASLPIGYSYQIEGAIRRYGGNISYDGGGDANTLIRTFTLENNSKLAALEETLREINPDARIVEVGEVHLVGNGMKHDPNIPRNAIDCLIRNKIRTLTYQHSISSCSFIVSKTKSEHAARILHECLFRQTAA